MGGEDGLTNQLAHQEGHKMLSTKVRNTVIALVAASSFAAASLVPAISQAKPINPYRGVTTKQAVKKQVVGGVCGTLGQRYNESLRQLEKAHNEEDPAGIKQERERANEYFAAGFELGCAFAA
jgi:hypothetical protein